MRAARITSTRRRLAGLIAFAALAACAGTSRVADTTTTTTTTTSTTTTTISPTTTQATTTTSSTTSTSTTSTSTTSTTSTSTTIVTSTTDGAAPVIGGTADPPVSDPPVPTSAPVPPIAAPPAAGVPLPALNGAFESLTHGNQAVSFTVLRDGQAIYRRAGGITNGGAQVTTSTPLVLASVSKLVTSLTIARLAEQHRVDIDAPMPWAAMGIAHDPAWDGVTARELLTHTSGMPVAGDSWFDDPGSCAIPLQEAMSRPPRATRGTWRYSNGNYCALGLLVEHLTGARRDAVARSMALDALVDHDAHLTTDVPLPTDGPYVKGVARLERLGGAGTWMASSDTIADMIAAVTPEDLVTMAYPAVMLDQYGWGHTGTVDGAKACAWRLEDGRTELVALVAGNRPSSGGRLCDLVLPALASDLGLGDLGVPHRLPD